MRCRRKRLSFLFDIETVFCLSTGQKNRLFFSTEKHFDRLEIFTVTKKNRGCGNWGALPIRNAVGGLFSELWQQMLGYYCHLDLRWIRNYFFKHPSINVHLLHRVCNEYLSADYLISAGQHAGDQAWPGCFTSSLKAIFSVCFAFAHINLYNSQINAWGFIFPPPQFSINTPGCSKPKLQWPVEFSLPPLCRMSATVCWMDTQWTWSPNILAVSRRWL